MKIVAKEGWKELSEKMYFWVRFKGEFLVMRRDGNWFVGEIDIQISEAQEVYEIATPKEIHQEISKAWQDGANHASRMH